MEVASGSASSQRPVHTYRRTTERTSLSTKPMPNNTGNTMLQKTLQQIEHVKLSRANTVRRRTSKSTEETELEAKLHSKMAKIPISSVNTLFQEGNAQHIVTRNFKQNPRFSEINSCSTVDDFEDMIPKTKTMVLNVSKEAAVEWNSTGIALTSEVPPRHHRSARGVSTKLDNSKSEVTIIKANQNQRTYSKQTTKELPLKNAEVNKKRKNKKRFRNLNDESPDEDMPSMPSTSQNIFVPNGGSLLKRHLLSRNIRKASATHVAMPSTSKPNVSVKASAPPLVAAPLTTKPKDSVKVLEQYIFPRPAVSIPAKKPAPSPTKVLVEDGYMSDDSASMHSRMSVINDFNLTHDYAECDNKKEDLIATVGSEDVNDEESGETIIVQVVQNSDEDPGEIIFAHDEDGNLICMQKGENGELIMLPTELVECLEEEGAENEPAAEVTEEHDNNNSFDIGSKQVNEVIKSDIVKEEDNKMDEDDDKREDTKMVEDANEEDTKMVEEGVNEDDTKMVEEYVKEEVTKIVDENVKDEVTKIVEDDVKEEDTNMVADEVKEEDDTKMVEEDTNVVEDVIEKDTKIVEDEVKEEEDTKIVEEDTKMVEEETKTVEDPVETAKVVDEPQVIVQPPEAVIADVGNEEIVAEAVSEVEECAIPIPEDSSSSPDTVKENVSVPPLFIINTPETSGLISGATPLELAFVQTMQGKLTLAHAETAVVAAAAVVVADEVPVNVVGYQPIATDLETLLKAQDQCRIVDYISSDSDEHEFDVKHDVVSVDRLTHADITKMVLGEGLDARLVVDEDKSLDLLQLPADYEPKPIIFTRPIVPITLAQVDGLPIAAMLQQMEKKENVKANNSGKTNHVSYKTSKNRRHAKKHRSKFKRPKTKHIHVTGDSYFTSEESPDVGTETDLLSPQPNGNKQTLDPGTSDVSTLTPDRKPKRSLPRKILLSPMEKKISKDYNFMDVIVNLNAEETDRLSIAYQKNKSTSDVPESKHLSLSESQTSISTTQSELFETKASKATKKVGKGRHRRTKLKRKRVRKIAAITELENVNANVANGGSSSKMPVPENSRLMQSEESTSNKEKKKAEASNEVGAKVLSQETNDLDTSTNIPMDIVKEEPKDDHVEAPSVQSATFEQEKMEVGLKESPKTEIKEDSPKAAATKHDFPIEPLKEEPESQIKAILTCEAQTNESIDSAQLDNSAPSESSGDVTTGIKRKRRSLAMLSSNDLDLKQIGKTRSATVKKQDNVIVNAENVVNVGEEIMLNSEISISAVGGAQVTPQGLVNKQKPDNDQDSTKNMPITAVNININDTHVNGDGYGGDMKAINENGTQESPAQNPKMSIPIPLVGRNVTELETTPASTTKRKILSKSTSKKSSVKNDKMHKKSASKKFLFKVNVKNLVSKAKSSLNFVDKATDKINSDKGTSTTNSPEIKQEPQLSTPKSTNSKSKKRKTISPFNLNSEVTITAINKKRKIVLNSPKQEALETKENKVHVDDADVVFVSDNTNQQPIVITDDPELVININNELVVKKEDDMLPIEEDHYYIGDLIFGRLGTFCFWPCMITEDPISKLHRKLIGNYNTYHVRFFGDNGRRAWIAKSSLIRYEGPDTIINNLEKLQAIKRAGVMWSNKIHRRSLAACKIPRSMMKTWRKGVDEAESLICKTVAERHEFFFQMFASQREKEDRYRKEHSSSINGKVAIKQEVDGTEIKQEAENETTPLSKPVHKKRKITYSEEKTTQTPKTSKSSAAKRKTRTSNGSNNANNKSVNPVVVESTKVTEATKQQLKSNYVIEDLELILQGSVKRDGSVKEEPRDETDVRLDGVVKGPVPGVPDPPEPNRKSQNRRKERVSNHSLVNENVKNLGDLKMPLKLRSQIDVASELSDTASSSTFSAQSGGNRRTLFKDVPRIPVCQVCLKNNDIVLKCKGNCCGFYHSECVQWKEEPKEDKDVVAVVNAGSQDAILVKPLDGNTIENANNKKLLDDFTCTNCKLQVDPSCFACDSTVYLGEHVKRFRCSVNGCGKYFHKECLKCWPHAIIDYAQIEGPENFVFKCPMHNCQVCTAENPKACTTILPIIKTARCLKCPGTYHINSFCIPAGTELLSHTQLICPRHVDRKRKRYTINTNWCFICSRGGNLTCCETCPTSVHQECISINLRPDDTFVCEDCESGRLPLYDEIVWAKFSSFKWWPGVILLPEDVPENVNTFAHRPGEFVVRFYGTHDHHWFGLGRVFLFHEGDKGEGTMVNRKDVSFLKAVAEAKAALVWKKELKRQREMASRKNMKPPPYTRIRINRMIGNTKSVFDGDVSNTNVCNCNITMENPCGPESDCLNMLLMTECDPEMCPAKEKCQNQRFEKRPYPPLMPYKTESRGWGLMSSEPITKGQFVIEYVGDVIDQEEYQRRMAKMSEQKSENFYFLTIDSNRIIDAGPKGNLARFMNHCCKPNCETQKWTIKGDTRVGLFALEDIPANTELTFNYNLATVGNLKKICHCGAENCSGFLGVKNKEANQRSRSKKKKPVPNETNQSKTEAIEPVKNFCFICNQLECDIDCTTKNCCKSYHIKCLEIQTMPSGKWTCPRHYCNTCTKRTIRCCKLCLESYCPMHSFGLIKFNQKLGYVCNMHNPETNPALQETTTTGSTSTSTTEIVPKTESKQDIAS